MIKTHRISLERAEKFDVQNDSNIQEIDFDIEYEIGPDEDISNVVYTGFTIWIDGESHYIPKLRIRVGNESDFDSLGNFFSNFDCLTEIKSQLEAQKEQHGNLRNHG